MVVDFSVLIELRWNDGNSEGLLSSRDGAGKALLCLPEALGHLKKRESLRELSIQLPSLDSFEQDPTLNGFVSLRGFKNLTLLEIFGISRDLDYHHQNLFIQSLASVLHDCPKLKTFGIGMECEHDDAVEQVVFIAVPDQLYYFNHLCAEYSSGAEVVPLSLEVLRLGFGMFITPWDNPDDAENEAATEENIIARFVNLDHLRTLHIFNGNVEFADVNDHGTDVEVDWTLLEAKSLRQLSVTLLTETARDYLNFGARSVDELIVTHHYSPHNEWSLMRYAELASAFTTIVTWELDINDDREWQESWGIPSLPASIEDVPILERTVLDRLGEYRVSHIERLSICLRFTQQWVGPPSNSYRN